jgi:hypothetical protein
LETFGLGVKTEVLRIVLVKHSIWIPYDALIRNGLLLSVKSEDPADWPGLFVTYCFNYTRWRETTMPLTGKYFLFCFLMVGSILVGRGA